MGKQGGVWRDGGGGGAPTAGAHLDMIDSFRLHTIWPDGAERGLIP